MSLTVSGGPLPLVRLQQWCKTQARSDKNKNCSRSLAECSRFRPPKGRICPASLTKMVPGSRSRTPPDSLSVWEFPIQTRCRCFSQRLSRKVRPRGLHQRLFTVLGGLFTVPGHNFKIRCSVMALLRVQMASKGRQISLKNRCENHLSFSYPFLYEELAERRSKYVENLSKFYAKTDIKQNW